MVGIPTKLWLPDSRKAIIGHSIVSLSYRYVDCYGPNALGPDKPKQLHGNAIAGVDALKQNLLTEPSN
jgi:hypothetical protein